MPSVQALLLAELIGRYSNAEGFDAALAGKDVTGSLTIAGALWDVVQIYSQLIVDHAAGRI